MAFKTVEYSFTHNNTIVECTFRGDFKLFIEPAKAILQATVPSSNRSYNPSTKTWEMTIEYWGPYKALLNSMRCRFVLKTPASASNSADGIPHVSKEYAEKFFYEQAPIVTVESTESIAAKLSEYLEVTITTQELSELKALYRKKAREYHPDFGGDAKKMSELNRLWTLYSNGGKVN